MRSQTNVDIRADLQRTKREKEERSRELELCVIGDREPLEPLMVGPPGVTRGGRAEHEHRLSSFLGLDESEEKFLTWLETYKLNAKQIDVTSRWGISKLLLTKNLICRIVFPMAFLIFTSAYWTYYTHIYTEQKHS